MEKLQTKVFTFSKIDFGILITCSMVMGIQFYDMTTWKIYFEDILVFNISPLIIGALGIFYGFSQRKDKVGKIILAIICVLNSIFAIWWIVLSIELFQSISGYYDFVNIAYIIIFGGIFVSPILLCGLQAWKIYTNTVSENSISVSAFNLIAVIAVSLMIVFNQFQFFKYTLLSDKFWWDYIMAGLAGVGYVSTSLGVFGTLKDHLLALMIYTASQFAIYIYFFAAIVCGNQISAPVPYYNGIYITIMAFLLISCTAVKTYDLKKNPPTRDSAVYNQIV